MKKNRLTKNNVLVRIADSLFSSTPGLESGIGSALENSVVKKVIATARNSG